MKLSRIHEMNEHPTVHRGLSAASLLVAAGRDRRPGSPLNRPLVPASNFILGTERAYSRDDGTPTWEALEEIVGILEGGDTVAYASGMAGAAATSTNFRSARKSSFPTTAIRESLASPRRGSARGFGPSSG
jgi:cystathionine gamma-synthase